MLFLNEHNIQLLQLLRSGGTILLEPVMQLEVVTTQETLSVVISDLSRRRAQIQQVSSRGQSKVRDSNLLILCTQFLVLLLLKNILIFVASDFVSARKVSNTRTLRTLELGSEKPSPQVTRWKRVTRTTAAILLCPVQDEILFAIRALIII